MIERRELGYILTHGDMGEDVTEPFMTRLEMTEGVEFVLRDAIGLALVYDEDSGDSFMTSETRTILEALATDL